MCLAGHPDLAAVSLHYAQKLQHLQKMWYVLELQNCVTELSVGM